jgi:hypothetical protein
MWVNKKIKKGKVEGLKRLFVSEGFYWLEFRCAPRRVEGEDYTDSDTER